VLQVEKRKELLAIIDYLLFIIDQLPLLINEQNSEVKDTTLPDCVTQAGKTP
jgi:hypothetical protein